MPPYFRWWLLCDSFMSTCASRKESHVMLPYPISADRLAKKQAYSTKLAFWCASNSYELIGARGDGLMFHLY
mgnify:CR=1 FL=1